MSGFILALLIGLPQEESSRPPLAADDVKLLKGNNIFAPARPKRALRSTSRSSGGSTYSKPAEPDKPWPPYVTGIILDSKSSKHRVIVEDRQVIPKKGKPLKLFDGPKFLEAGDEFLDFKIASVAGDRVVVRQGEVETEIFVGQFFPGEGSGPPPEVNKAIPSSKGKSPLPTLTESRRNAALERMRAARRAEEEKEETKSDEP